MKLTCPCERVTLSLPDEKLPASGRFLVGCPECGKRVRITRTPYGTEAAFAEEPAAANAEAGATPPSERPEVPETPERPPQRYIVPDPIPPGRTSAFLALANEAFSLAAKAFLRESGHYPRKACADMEEAAADLRVNGHELCLIEDIPEFAPLLAETLSWPGDRRRRTAVVLVGEYDDFDVKSAFYKGVDAVLNKSEPAEAAKRLKTALQNFRRRTKAPESAS